MIRLDIHAESERRKLLQVFENNAKSWLIYNRHFLSLSKDFFFLVPRSIFSMLHVQRIFIQTAACGEPCMKTVLCVCTMGSSWDTEDSNTYTRQFE